MISFYHKDRKVKTAKVTKFFFFVIFVHFVVKNESSNDHVSAIRPQKALNHFNAFARIYLSGY
jgi:hypothetical protein